MEVEEWVAGHETAQAMLRRVLPRTSANMPLVAPLQRVSMHAHDVLEVAGPSGSAKSEFLLQVPHLCISAQLKSFISWVLHWASDHILCMMLCSRVMCHCARMSRIDFIMILVGSGGCV